ncbi:rod shape-determining protein MreC [Candidatus Gottesmanbacteria bacterium]|nr:rod shape-determining protein MreC [Candidatus Gottesmanbacteria bacterium]
MRYQRRAYSPLVIYAFAFVICLVLLMGDITGILRFLRLPLESAVFPPRVFIYGIKKQIDNNIKIIFTPNLEAKLIEADVKERVIDVLESKIQILETENQNLRSQLETPLPVSWDYIPAQVLGLDHYLIVDKGEVDKVMPGMTVLYKDMFVGKVKTVNSRTSQVEIPTDSELKIQAKTNKNIKGLLTGAFGNQILLTRILQKESVNNFDIVLTSGEEGEIPPNLIIGKVKEVLSTADGVYKEAVVDPILDYSQLRYVFILSSF